MKINIYNINNACYRKKMVGFDYDWTLVKPKNNKTFPKDIDDWCWLYDTVPNKIKEYYEDNFMIVIFTNQSKIWKKKQIKKVLKSLKIPLTIVVATDKTVYKPCIDMFNELFSNYKINKNQSFFVGDALGRKIDFSDSDKLFAQNIEIDYYSPEEIFCEINENFEIPNIEILNKQEIIIMVGFPASGKSTISKKICENENYIHIEGDVYKTTKKMINTAIPFIKNNKSIVFDATNKNEKIRKEYLNLANEYNLLTRCIYVSTPFDVSFNRNKLRNNDEQIPIIAYYTFRKYFEYPNEKEGFQLIII